MQTHAALLTALGGTQIVCQELKALTGEDFQYERVKKWRQIGVPPGYRPHVAVLARRKSVALPEGFLPAELLNPGPNDQGTAAQEAAPQERGDAA